MNTKGINRSEAEQQLKKQFGIERFYDEQWQAVQRLLLGERVLMIERTGFGKSLCYQFPATQFDGMTIVFSPLIALMRDQVQALARKGIAARYINSEQSEEENEAVIQDAVAGKIKILYIAPERQENEAWLEAVRNPQMRVSMIVIDEAHCISVWGHDFRPAFRRIVDLVQLQRKDIPVLACTATATLRVQNDIEAQVGGSLTTIRGNLMRPNFNLYVLKTQSEDEKMLWLAENINKLPGSGLIYTGTRTDAEIYARWLSYNGVEAVCYHAGLEADRRKQIEQDLMSNRWKCVVSTNALGMGIDKPDIRFLIHTQVPVSPIHYYQEIGRAGRDGKPTEIILFYNEKKDANGIPEDYKLPKAFIDGARPDVSKYQKVIDAARLEPMGLVDLERATNLKRNQIRIIVADLIEQGIVREVVYDRRKIYEYQYNAKPLDTAAFEKIRFAKLKDLDAMIGYIHTKRPRMEYLCGFLDDRDAVGIKNCDNTNLEKLHVPDNQSLVDKLMAFRDCFSPILEVASAPTKTYKETGDRFGFCRSGIDRIEISKNRKLIGHISVRHWKNDLKSMELRDEEKEFLTAFIESKSATLPKLVNGVAASYYGVSEVGNAIHHCKYEQGGDYPDNLLKLTLKAFRKTFGNQKFDLILYVPPTKSGDLVRNFAVKISNVLGIPVSHDLVKKRTTREQKVFQNSLLKRENVSEAFVFLSPEELNGKTVLLIDDIFDSGATIGEIGKLLTEAGAEAVAPLVIAKTVGGDI